MSALTIVKPSLESELINIVICSASPATGRAYKPHIAKYLIAGRPLERIHVENYLHSIDSHSISTRAQALAALKRLASVAHAHGQLSEQENWSIAQVSLDSKQTHRLGRWLSKDQIQKLYSLPDRSTVIGTRDAAIFALLLGCGLRREEACRVTIGSYQERDGRMCLVDLWGKGSKQRTIPVPRRAVSDLDTWCLLLAGGGLAIESSPILRRTPKGLHVARDLSKPLDPNGLWFIIKSYAKVLGVDFSPHDLRRSMARAMRKAGAPLEQVQIILGHASLRTTERYLGLCLELEQGKAATDLLDLGEEL